MRATITQIRRRDPAGQAESNRRSRHALLLLAALLGSVARLHAQPAPQSFTAMVAASGLIFEGTVTAVGASTPSIPREAGTMVVKVDKVIEALPPIGNPSGQQVTVRASEPIAMKVGDRAVFYTYLYAAGRSLGLQQVGATPLQMADAGGLRVQVRQARIAVEDQKLVARLRTALMVVSGVIGKPVPLEAPEARRGEHDPMWWRAPIKVDAVLAGATREGVTMITFASGDDPEWVTAPKLHAGEKGVFVLQPATLIPASQRTDGVFVLDPLDVRPTEDVPRIRTLVKVSR